MAPSMNDQPDDRASERRGQIRRSLERYVYVIEFSSGTVKVGQTANPRARLGEHDNAAQAHGHTIQRSWVSAPHTAYKENEGALIAFGAERWPNAVGREAFTDADYEVIVEFALGLQYERLSEGDMVALLTRAETVQAEWDKGRQHRLATTEMAALQEKVELLAPLVNDENRWAACDSFFEILKKAIELEPAPWGHEDPTAAERYLTTRGATSSHARATAAEFELNFRALFALKYRREAKSFEEIARFCDSVTAGPAQLDLGGAA